jgi:putative transcriptional regulator
VAGSEGVARRAEEEAESGHRVRGGDQGGEESEMRKKRDLGDELIGSMQEALDHARGKPVKVRVTRVRLPPLDVKAVRQKLRLTQRKMAQALGVSVSGLRKWEQGDRRPGGAALTLLRVMEREPKAVKRALSDAA